MAEQNCGTCSRSYPNSNAVGVRLGCWEGHVHPLSFNLPHDGVNCPDWKLSEQYKTDADREYESWRAPGVAIPVKGQQ